jgi:hypothetical protein
MGIEKDDAKFCNWFEFNYPEQYKYYRKLWIVAGKPNQL